MRRRSRTTCSGGSTRSMPRVSGLPAMSEQPLQRARESAADAHRDVLRLMRSGDWRAAEAACQAMNARYPDYAAGWQCASHIALRLDRMVDALGHIDRALSIEP